MTSESDPRTLTRRQAVATAVAAPLAAAAVSAAASNHDTAGDNPVAAAFQNLVSALSSGDLDSFYGAMHDDFVMIDEDSPYRMSKAQFEDHIGFHIGGVWDRFQWLPVDTRANAYGNSGSVTGTATFRGKPKDDGFRIRHLLFTQTWTRSDRDAWKLLLWHQSPVDGHIDGASPS